MIWEKSIFVLMVVGGGLFSGCGGDPILTRADQERAEEGSAGQGDPYAPGTLRNPGPGQPGQPTPGDPGQPEQGAAVQPPPGAPDQPQPGMPDQPRPGVPDQPGGQAADPGVPSEGPMVRIQGEVRYAGYSQGKVRVDVFDGDQRDHTKRPGVVGWADLDGPGPFDLAVSQASGKVWLSAFNDANGDGRPGHEDPTGFMADNPLVLDEDAISGVVIELKLNPKPDGDD